MHTIPGRRGAGKQGLHLTDDRGRADLQGESAGASAMPGVHKGYGKGVTGDAPKNIAQCGERGVGTRGRRGIWGRQSQDL